MLAALLSLIDPISRIGKAIADARIAAANAQTDRDRIASEEKVKTLEARRDVLVAEAGRSSANTYARLFLTAPIGVLLWKVFVYDKALGQWTGGRTDALSPELWNVVMVVVGFYFVYEAASVLRGRK